MPNSTAVELVEGVGQVHFMSSGFTVRRFSLVELLVVIGVIALLASMLMPALSMARKQGKSISCVNNLKQIGYASFNYADENDGYVLPADLGDVGGYRSWINYLYSRVNAKSTFVCPSLSQSECFDPYGGSAVVDIKYGAYVMNTIEAGAWNGAAITADPTTATGWGNNSANPVKIMRVSNHSDVVFILDFVRCTSDHSAASWGSDARSLRSFLETDFGPIGYGTDFRDVGWRHFDSFNVLYGDSHAGNLKHSMPDQWVAVGR
jgi:type II secretory pathway pseudopilin PulG